MHNGLTTSLSLYPIKYLNEFFVPYGSSLETNILLTSISSILNSIMNDWNSSMNFRCKGSYHILYLGSKLIF